jgi:hypothetical protein
VHHHINSILAVIYLTKLQNLINRPVMNCSMSIFPYFYITTKSQLEDADAAMSSTMVRNSNIQNPPVLIRSYRKVQTFRERMNRLLQMKNYNSTDIFNVFVARLRSAIAHLLDERSSEDHD